MTKFKDRERVIRTSRYFHIEQLSSKFNSAIDRYVFFRRCYNWQISLSLKQHRELGARIGKKASGVCFIQNMSTYIAQSHPGSCSVFC